MKYQVDKLYGSRWDRYAECPIQQYAREIADGLLEKGHTIRISEVGTTFTLGPIEQPKKNEAPTP